MLLIQDYRNWTKIRNGNFLKNARKAVKNPTAGKVPSTGTPPLCTLPCCPLRAAQFVPRAAVPAAALGAAGAVAGAGGGAAAAAVAAAVGS